jgi:Papain-like cysteine protease AvrRpt2
MAWTLVDPEVVNIPQPNASTCWLACLQMLYVWKGKKASEPLQKLSADPDIEPDYWVDNGISPDNCISIARCLGLGRAGDGDADITYLGAALKQHGPYWVTGEWIKGSPHVKVIIGCDPALNQIKLLNPWNPIDPVDFASIEAFNNRGTRWKVLGSFMYWS